ncbi:hypothetical protein TRVL_03815 [Trypanosoma vivax]|nr:hypothetical protein TRVL_03815 [Trypanosoma vivax]
MNVLGCSVTFFLVEGAPEVSLPVISALAVARKLSHCFLFSVELPPRNFEDEWRRNSWQRCVPSTRWQLAREKGIFALATVYTHLRIVHNDDSLDRVQKQNNNTKTESKQLHGSFVGCRSNTRGSLPKLYLDVITSCLGSLL